MSDVEPRRIGIRELEARLGVTRKAIGDWVKAGRLPRPHYLAGLRRWWLHDIKAWEALNVSDKTNRRPIQ